MWCCGVGSAKGDRKRASLCVNSAKLRHLLYPPPSQDVDHAFEDKLAALKASLLSQPTTTPPDSSSVEGDISESQLVHKLGAAPDSSTPEFEFLLRPPSPVTTEDLSESDLKEVFGETTGQHDSGFIAAATGGSTGVSTGSSTGGAAGTSRVGCTGGSSSSASVGDEGGSGALSSLAACSVVRPPQCGQLHVSLEQEQMAALQARCVEQLPSIVNELQAALGEWHLLTHPLPLPLTRLLLSAGSLLHAIMTAYKIPEEEQGNIREAIEPVVEQAFFPPLWPHLIKAFRSARAGSPEGHLKGRGHFRVVTRVGTIQPFSVYMAYSNSRNTRQALTRSVCILYAQAKAL